jgi:hypothetical protein
MGVPTATIVGSSPSNADVKSNSGTLRFTFFAFTFSTSYANPGGEAFDPRALHSGIGTVLAVFVNPKTGWTFRWDSAAKKIVAYSTANTEVANAANLSVTPGVLDVLVVSR